MCAVEGEAVAGGWVVIDWVEVVGGVEKARGVGDLGGDLGLWGWVVFVVGFLVEDKGVGILLSFFVCVWL